MELQNMSSSEENEEELLLPGFRFHPTDEELVGFYLRRKVEMKPISIELIKRIDIYKYDPWDLPKVSSTTGEKEWYFFCIRERKYKNSIRPNRVTGSGFWKATGIDRPIYPSSAATKPNSDSIIGLKKSLVYYRGVAGKGTKTDWMMHEFRLPVDGKDTNITGNKNISQEAEIWTICRIFKRNVTYRKYGQEKSTVLSSKSCSSESETRYNITTGNFGVFRDEQIERKPVINQLEEINQFFISPQAPSATFYSTIHAGNNGGFLRDYGWDENGSILDFAIDPILGCRYSA